MDICFIYSNVSTVHNYVQFILFVLPARKNKKNQQNGINVCLNLNSKRSKIGYKTKMAAG